MRFSITFYIIVFLSLNLSAQFLNIGGNTTATAQANFTEPQLWAVASNQSALVFSDYGYYGGINYENFFLVKELSLKSAAFVWNSKKYGAFDLIFNSFGYSNYNQNNIGLGYSMKLANFISAGIQLDYFFFHQPQPYGNISFVTGEIGITIKPTDKLFVGMHLFNPWRTKVLVTEREYFPTIFELGITYNLLDNLNFYSSLQKDLDLPVFFKNGVQYEIIKNLKLRTGISFSQNDYFIGFGVGYTYKLLTLDLGFEQHPVLGLKSGISLSAKF